MAIRCPTAGVVPSLQLETLNAPSLCSPPCAMRCCQGAPNTGQLLLGIIMGVVVGGLAMWGFRAKVGDARNVAQRAIVGTGAVKVNVDLSNFLTHASRNRHVHAPAFQRAPTADWPYWSISGLPAHPHRRRQPCFWPTLPVSVSCLASASIVFAGRCSWRATQQGRGRPRRRRRRALGERQVVRLDSPAAAKRRWRPQQQKQQQNQWRWRWRQQQQRAKTVAAAVADRGDGGSGRQQQRQQATTGAVQIPQFVSR